MTDDDRKTKTQNMVVICLRTYKGYGLLREISLFVENGICCFTNCAVEVSFKRLSTSTVQPSLARNSAAMLRFCGLPWVNMISGVMFFLFIFRWILMVIISRSWSLPMSASGNVLVFGLFTLDLNFCGGRL